MILGMMFFVLALNPSLAIADSSDREPVHPSGIFQVQQESGNDTGSLAIRFLAPQDGDMVDYGMVEINFEIESSNNVSSLSLLVGNDIKRIHNYETPYSWRPTRDGVFILTLQCSDDLSNVASDSITITVIIRQDLSPIGLLVILVGMIAVSSVVYRHRARSSPTWDEDPDYQSILSIPFHYFLRSRFRRGKGVNRELQEGNAEVERD